MIKTTLTMKIIRWIIPICLSSPFATMAQSLTPPSELTFTKNNLKDINILLQVESTGLETLAIEDENKIVKYEIDPSSTLHHTEFRIYFTELTLKQLKEKKKTDLLVVINKDDKPDREKNLKIKLFVADPTDASKKDFRNALDFTIKPFEAKLDGYNHLVYIGTNFDLVEGVRPKNVFFASNTYLPFTENRGGLFFSLYGNRSQMTTDSVIFTSRVIGFRPETDSTGLELRSTSKGIRASVSDNSGVNVLLPYGNLCKANSTLKAYPMLSAEFIWRRKTVSFDLENIGTIDSISVNKKLSYVDFEKNFSRQTNEYTWNIGAGIFMLYDTEKISVRFYTNIGYGPRYTPLNPAPETGKKYETSSGFNYVGRLWITDPSTGLTLNGEVINYFPVTDPYYAVTLSKAIKFSSMGDIFAPIVKK